jgi:hypothetical protein
MTAPPINLNKARKTKARAEAAAKAGENRIKFGLTKAEKQAKALQAAKAARALDGHKRER